MALDVSVVTAVITSASTVAASVWAGVMLFKKKMAEARVESAVSNATVSTANAQTELYGLLKDRLATLETKVADLESANARKDEMIRQLRDHIDELEVEMREHGLNPPKLVIASP